MNDILAGFRDPEVARHLVDEIHRIAVEPCTLMEVCGTHTMAIAKHGLRGVMPETIKLLSGPGCPVCVTANPDIDLAIEIARQPGVVLTTFGDMMKVPGSYSSLSAEKAEGRDVRVVYSPLDSLAIAEREPDKQVVFLGVGFETTAPTVAATVLMARAQGLKNFKVLSFHKLVPPALEVLLADKGTRIDGFILPGHVSAVIGLAPYLPIAERYGKAAAITGFEPVDILQALIFLAKCKTEGRAEVTNLYRRVVSDAGNAKARQIMEQVFDPADALWRGIGLIPGSGLEFSKEFEEFDAKKLYGITIEDCPPLPGCKCGEVLKGRIRPDECPLFKKSCTPAKPVGPCMVSTEGSCAAYFKYQVE